VTSDSVFVDLLTYADLEALKSKRSGTSKSCSSSAHTNNKRYLILTYAAEFDRVHYPLPLLHEDNPAPAALMATIARLKQENAHLAQAAAGGGLKGGGGGSSAKASYGAGSKAAADSVRVKEENEALRAQVRQLQRQLATAEKAAAAAAGGGRGVGDSGGSVREAAAYEQVEHLQAELKAAGKEMRVVGGCTS
jgi:coiled-coil domain-containing protein 61